MSDKHFALQQELMALNHASATPRSQPPEEANTPMLTCTCIASAPTPVLDRVEDYTEEAGVVYLRITNSIINRYQMTQIVTDPSGTIMEVLNQTEVDLPVSSVVELVQLREEGPEDENTMFEEII